MKKIWIFILFMLVIFSVNADAQLTSLSQLPTGKRAISLGYTNFIGDHWGRFDVEHSFTDRTKAAFITELGIYSASDHVRMGIGSYYQVVHVEPSWTTSLDYFLVGFVGFHGEIVSGPIADSSGRATFDEYLHYFSVSGGGGLLLKTMGRFKPFVGLTYNRYFAVSEDYVTNGFFSILPGFDFRISPHIGVIGQVSLDYEPGFGFYDGVSVFFIGLRFH